MPIFDDEPATGGIVFDDEPATGGIVFDDEKPDLVSLLAAPGHALSSALESAGLTGAPGPIARGAAAAAAAQAAWLKRDQGALGSFEYAKSTDPVAQAMGSIADEGARGLGTLDAVLRAGTQAVTGVDMTPSGPRHTTALALRTGTDPAAYEAEVDRARTRDELKQGRAKDIQMQ